MKEKETYTVKEAMERLGLKSVNAFLRLERKYPEAFVIMKRDTYRQVRRVRYDKASIDRFAEKHEYFKKDQA